MATATVAEYLQVVLGQRLTAVIARVSDAKAVGQWAKGGRNLHPEGERRLWDSYQVTQLLMQREAADTVRVWFRGMNTHLDDDAPALALATEPARVLQAPRGPGWVSPAGIRVARTPRGPLYRIGHAPSPLAWPPREFTGADRCSVEAVNLWCHQRRDPRRL